MRDYLSFGCIKWEGTDMFMGSDVLWVCFLDWVLSMLWFDISKCRKAFTSSELSTENRGIFSTHCSLLVGLNNRNCSKSILPVTNSSVDWESTRKTWSCEFL